MYNRSPIYKEKYMTTGTEPNRQPSGQFGSRETPSLRYKMTAMTKLTSLMLLAVFLIPKWSVYGEPEPNESKSRGSRQLFFRYRFPYWPGHPVAGHTNFNFPIPGNPAYGHPIHGKYTVPYHQFPSEQIPVYSAPTGNQAPVGYTVSGRPVFFNNNDLNYPFHQLNANYQDKIKEEQLIDSLSSEALKWIKNLNEDEQESLTAWTLASAAVASLMRGKFIGSSSFDPVLFNGFAAAPNHFSPDGQERTPSRPGSSNGQQEDPEGKTFETFLVIKEVIRQVAISIKSCQVVFFKKCAYFTTSTTTTTPSTTTTTSTTSTTPMTTTTTTEAPTTMTP